MADKKDIIVYRGSEDWSALYLDGKLIQLGDHYLVQEKIEEIFGIEVYDSDDFLRGGNSREYAAQTLEEVNEYRSKRSQIELDAFLLESQARTLEAQARKLRDSLGNSSAE